MMWLKLRAAQWKRLAGAVAGAAIMFSASGCQPQPQNQTSTQGSVPPANITKTVVTNVPIKDTTPLNTVDDPCALRIGDLTGQLLIYYSRNHRGPAKIEELAPYAFADVPFETTCPVSRKPYLCAPNGLRAPGENIQIYIYDAAPVHHGERWCVVIKDGAISGAGFFTDHIPEARFQKFLAASAAATQAAPSVAP